MTHLHIEYRLVESLIPFAKNARTHTEEQITQIAASIREFGFNNPILVDGHHGIVSGHGRLSAARKLSMTEVPVIELEHLSDIQKRAFILAENKLAEKAGWDHELLALELADLGASGVDLELTGFDASEIESMLAKAGEETDTSSDEVADEIPETPVKAISRTGDIWQLGKHRLICGDAADPDVITALMAGQQAELCFTSPPYGNQRDYTTGGIGDWDALMQGVFACLPMAEEGQVLVNLGLVHRDNEVIPYWDQWLTWMQGQNWRRFAWYVWDQGSGMPGDWAGRFAPSFEFVFHFNKQSRKPNKIVPCKSAGEHSHGNTAGSSATGMRKRNGDVGAWTHSGMPTQDTRIPDSVIRITRHAGGIGNGISHPAVFPVALPKHIMEAFTNPGDAVFDPFSGSGTSLLAAQRSGRHGYAVEIAPEYVDVAIRRFQQNYPDVVITLARTGKTFEIVQAEREGSEVTHV